MPPNRRWRENTRMLRFSSDSHLPERRYHEEKEKEDENGESDDDPFDELCSQVSSQLYDDDDQPRETTFTRCSGRLAQQPIGSSRARISEGDTELQRQIDDGGVSSPEQDITRLREQSQSHSQSLVGAQESSESPIDSSSFKQLETPCTADFRDSPRSNTSPLSLSSCSSPSTRSASPKDAVTVTSDSAQTLKSARKWAKKDGDDSWPVEDRLKIRKLYRVWKNDTVLERRALAPYCFKRSGAPYKDYLRPFRAFERKERRRKKKKEERAHRVRGESSPIPRDTADMVSDDIGSKRRSAPAGGKEVPERSTNEHTTLHSDTAISTHNDVRNIAHPTPSDSLPGIDNGIRRTSSLLLSEIPNPTSDIPISFTTHPTPITPHLPTNPTDDDGDDDDSSPSPFLDPTLRNLVSEVRRYRRVQQRQLEQQRQRRRVSLLAAANIDVHVSASANANANANCDGDGRNFGSGLLARREVEALVAEQGRREEQRGRQERWELRMREADVGEALREALEWEEEEELS